MNLNWVCYRKIPTLKSFLPLLICSLIPFFLLHSVSLKIATHHHSVKYVRTIIRIYYISQSCPPPLSSSLDTARPPSTFHSGAVSSRFDHGVPTGGSPSFSGSAQVSLSWTSRMCRTCRVSAFNSIYKEPLISESTPQSSAVVYA